LAPERPPIVVAAIEDASRLAAPIDIDLPIPSEAGPTRFVHLFGRTRSFGDGQIEVGGTLQDISARKHLEAELTRASEAERHRLSIELHENLGQLLFGTSLLLSAATREANGGGTRVLEMMERTAEALKETMQACRAIAHGSTPIVSGQLEFALLELAARTGAAGVECAPIVAAIGDAPLQVPWALGLYRIAQEAVTNALRHAACRRIEIALRRKGMTMTLEVRDDGRGFDLSQPGNESGLGIPTMRYRAARAGGTIEFRSRPGRGTTVSVRVPVSDGAVPR
jgi:signal transduction histidine kinase